MIVNKRMPLWEEGEYQYKGAGEFVPHMSAYLHEDTEVRPAMIVCPGGAYFLVSPTEGEIVAKAFYEKGYNCFVLTYTTNPSGEYPLRDQPMQDLSRAIRLVRLQAFDFHVNVNRVYICGFSAAGHLCASVCDYHKEIIDPDPSYQRISNRPDGAVLSYPVISSGAKAHQGSFEFLIDAEIYNRSDEEAKSLLEHYSMEKHVTEENPPAFIWHTLTDETVPVANSFLYEEQLRKYHIPHAMHLFSKGPHGLSLANEEWASKMAFGEKYTFDQFVKMKEAILSGSLIISDEKKEEFLKTCDAVFAPEQPAEAYLEVTIWPELADAFLKEIED